MWHDNDYSFSDAVAYFSEDGQLEREAEKIIEQERRKQENCQNQQGYSPFIQLDSCSDDEKAILDQHFLAQREKVKEQAQRTEEAEQPLPQPPLPMELPPTLVVQSIKALMNPKTAKSASGALTPYDLMNEVLARVRLVVHNEVFYQQDGMVFRALDEQELKRLVFAILEPLLAAGQSPRLIENVIDLMRKNPRICVQYTTESPDRVFFLNGAYHLEAHELMPIQPTNFFISYLSIYYSPDATACPCFDRYVETVSGGDPAVKRLIWEVLGYLLSYDMAGKAFFVLQGVGDSGKSVFGNLVASFFNTEALAHLDIFRFKDRFSTSALKGKRLNICMDLPRNKISREAIGVIKMLTGDDTITIEEKFRKSESYKPTCKLLFGSNFPLMPADLDDALLARLVTIPFRYSIPKDQQDKHLLDKLLVERCAIAVKALDAYLALKQRNYQFTPVQGVCGMTGYVKESELMETFVREQCVFQPEHYTFTADLQAAYNAFRIAHNVPPIEDTTAFSRQFNSFCAGQVTPKRVRCGRRNLNGYAGVGLRGPVPC